MDLAKIITHESNLLLTARNKRDAHKAVDLARRSDFHIGLVSEAVPLFTHLTLAENISLSNMYHQNFSLRQAVKRLEHAIKASGLEESLDKGLEELSRKEQVQAMFLRCLANNNSIVLIDTPSVKDMSVIEELNAESGARRRLWVLCLQKDAEKYQGFGLETVPVSD
jgi:ABC-type lipoprotein export system ATPase subunit